MMMNAPFLPKMIQSTISGEAATLEELFSLSSLIHRVLQILLLSHYAFSSDLILGLKCLYLLSPSLNISLNGNPLAPI